ncbi:MAG: hypothetical protein ACRDY7_02430 [Acidimicrobiia bacterium]
MQELGEHQDAQVDEGHRDAPDLHHHAACPARVELDAVDRSEQIDAFGRIAELHNRVRLGEVRRTDPDRPEAEVDKRLHETGGVPESSRIQTSRSLVNRG